MHEDIKTDKQTYVHVHICINIRTWDSLLLDAWSRSTCRGGPHMSGNSPINCRAGQAGTGSWPKIWKPSGFPKFRGPFWRVPRIRITVCHYVRWAPISGNILLPFFCKHLLQYCKQVPKNSNKALGITRRYAELLYPEGRNPAPNKP